MAVSRCPSCNTPLTHDEISLGKCPACKNGLGGAITLAPPKMEMPRSFPTSSLGYESPIAIGGSTLNWASVRTTLALFACGWILLLVSVSVIFLAVQAAPHNRGRGDGIIALISIVLVVGLVQVATAICMSCAAPADTGTKIWPILAVVSLTVSLVAFFVMMVTLMDIRSMALVRILSFLYLGGILLGKIFFSAFILAVARHFQNKELALACLIFLIVEIALVSFSLVRSLLENDLARPSDPMQAMVGGWITWIATLAMGIWFVIQVLMVRAVITRHILTRMS